VDWIDVFTRPIYRNIVVDSLKYCQQHKGLQVFSYVIMTNHIHLIVNSPNGHLSETLRDFKKFTAKTIISTILDGNESRRVWMLNRLNFNVNRNSRNENFQLRMH